MRDDRGFAIPMVVLLVALITVMLTSGFVRVRADRQVAEGQEVSSEALSVARSGLHLFLEAQATRPADGIVDTMYVTGGYAIVTATIVQNPADTMASQTWIVRSTGYVIDAGTGSVPRAQRTVAQFAEWQTGTIRVRAAWVAADGIQKPGGPPGPLPVTVDGFNQCGGSPTTAGLRAASVTGPSGKTIATSGSPNENLSEAGLADSSKIDWQSILDGGIKEDSPTPTIYPQYSDQSSITIVSGDYTTGTGILSGIYGSGLLIVTGRLRIRSWIIWSGVVLVGEDIDFEGGFIGSYIYGMLVSGLYSQVGNLGGARSNLTTSHTVQIRYNQCNIDAAMSGLTGFAPIDNAFVDNWATY
ncbi:MAG: hypothetical protein WD934_01240 [Gemmatimonadales bacterium]